MSVTLTDTYRIRFHHITRGGELVSGKFELYKTSHHFDGTFANPNGLDKPHDGSRGPAPGTWVTQPTLDLKINPQDL